MVSLLMTIKAVLISSGVASVGLLLKVYVPMVVDFSVSQAPVLWSSLLSWLKPPYLYVITNGIIITIVASSKYYGNSSNHHEHEDDDGVVYGGGDYKIQTEPIVHASASPRMLKVDDSDPDAQFGFVAANPPSPELETEAVMAVVFKDAEEVEEDESELKSVVMVENSNRNHLPLKMTESENLPPMNSRLAQASTKGGRAMLRATKPKRNYTLEDTWKMITEGKSTRLPRQLYRRSDTFSRRNSGEANPVYRKSETFRDRTNYYQSQLRKEPSLSQDDLNRRVEAFIKQFNEDMKLQRMESLRQYKEKTNHAS